MGTDIAAIEKKYERNSMNMTTTASPGQNSTRAKQMETCVRWTPTGFLPMDHDDDDYRNSFYDSICSRVRRLQQ